MKILKLQLPNLLILVPFLLLLASCTAGNSQFTLDNPAGFWYGLWHGVISFISLIIHIFNSNIAVYEIHNTGGWYDFGFLLGVSFIWGGSSHMSCKSAAKKNQEKEWKEIGEKVEAKIMRKLKEWAKNEDGTDNTGDDWEEISSKAEEKLKRKVREWADKE